ncbi:hypothetical protein HYC85_026174 [Camellia sinensis]|uniref:Bicarbonate transporter-like transmembrane domain-containing protein n=1 Tax=Camellia sinensis TaxID=4442 RepID=A0A7J7G421_CAMSI|nr:hypothetical protein HYC85_026174 [Camellia sinensis]
MKGVNSHDFIYRGQTTKNMKSPFRGIINDFKGKKVCYKQDWHDAFCSGTRILAPTTYIFFTSALPVIVFGEQLNRETDTLASTDVCGIIHSMFGGQPLLILGVAEPTVIMYTYLYNFTKEKAGSWTRVVLVLGGMFHFLDTTFRVCVWTAILLLLPAAFSTIISRFTRIAGKRFGTLIAVLFMQEAIKWLYINGLLAIIFSFGLLFTALKSKGARTWRCGTLPQK